MGNNFREILDVLQRLPIVEMTSASDIAFIPGGFKPMTKVLKGLAKKKKDWKLEVLDEDGRRTFNFEGDLRISVVTEDLEEFYSQVLCVDDFPENPGIIAFSLPFSLYESVQEVESAYDAMEDALHDYLIMGNVKVLDDHVALWEKYFGVVTYRPTHSFLTIDTVDKMEEGIAKQVANIRKIYGENIKQVNVITQALKSGNSLNSIKPFSAFKTMVGAKIISRYRGAEMVYEGSVGTSGLLSESIFVNDDKVLKAADDISQVKVVKNTIFPRGKLFPSNLFKSLRDDIKLTEEDDD